MKDEQMKQFFEDLTQANATAQALLTAAAARLMQTEQLTALKANVQSALASAKKVHPNSRIANLAIYIATESLAALDAEILLRQQEQQPGKSH